jgi:hypothetical protein
MANDEYMTLHFNDGSRLTFEFPEQGAGRGATLPKHAIVGARLRD